MEGKSTFLILLLIIVVLVVTLAVLTAFIFFGNNGSDVSTETVQEEVLVPNDEDLNFLELFEETKFYNLKPDEDNSAPIIQIDITLYYFNKVKGIKNVDEKIVQYSSKVKEITGLYFQNKTVTEIKTDPEFWTKTKEELKIRINKVLTSNEKSKEDIVYEVVFESWNYQ